MRKFQYALKEDNKQLVFADLEKKENNIKYICPSCKAPVILNKGEIKTPYFRHKSKQCDYNNYLHTTAIEILNDNLKKKKKLWKSKIETKIKTTWLDNFLKEEIYFDDKPYEEYGPYIRYKYSIIFDVINNEHIPILKNLKYDERRLPKNIELSRIINKIRDNIWYSDETIIPSDIDILNSFSKTKIDLSLIPKIDFITYLKDFLNKDKEIIFLEEKINFKFTVENSEIEKGINNFRADILATNNLNENILFEIEVTHKCSKEKINSGLPIVEITINDEDDLICLRKENYKKLNITSYNLENLKIK